jgi:hypothetical protein
MSLPGGTADKLGGRYESRWTLRCLLKILAEEADWIRVEPVGRDGDGIEFVLALEGREEHHQVKRQRTGQGHWTLKALDDERVLANFKTILERDGNPRFVSGHDADQLHVLGDRARQSQDLRDFLANWLGKGWEEHFQTLRSAWKYTDLQTYEALQRCNVITVGDDELAEWNRSLVERFLDAVPDTALAALAELVIANLQQTLDAAKLWQGLKDRYQIEPPHWADPTIHQQLRALTDDYRGPLEAVRLRHPIPRAEVRQALELLTSGDRIGVLLAGPAGTGKSDVILQILDAIQALGWPTLALRVDRLEDTARPEGIGEQLGLSTSPAAVLGALAKGAPCLLVVDQLDAVSLASGRLRRLWEPVYALLRQAQAQPGMRVLLASRQFDLDNDHRLRGLTSEGGMAHAVPVAPLAREQIETAMLAMGGDPARLTQVQYRLLALPLHLTLLEALVEADDKLTFTTANELFRLYWDRKREKVEERKEAVDWTGTLRLLSDGMSKARSLSVPRSKLELAGRDRDADVLTSESVLVQASGSVAFFHESFFDYAFARYFIAEGKGVLDLLQDDEQDLFRRAQVRQILVREREEDRGRYLVDLAGLLGQDDVRFHIKHLVLALLRDLADPTRAELDVLRPILEGDPEDPRWGPAWRALGTPEWFAVAECGGILQGWLASPESALKDGATWVLADGAKGFPARAVKLLHGVLSNTQTWRRRRGYVVRMTNVTEDRALFELLLSHAGEHADEPEEDDVWLDGHELPERRPEWAGEFLALMLKRLQERAVAAGDAHPFEGEHRLQDNHSAGEFVKKLAETAPRPLIDAALPWVLEVARADVDCHGSSLEDEGSLDVDRVWGWRYRNDQFGLKDELRNALERGLQTLAVSEPEAFKYWAQILADSQLDIAQYLLYRGILGNPPAFAEWIGEQLLSAESRWRAGYTDGPYWATRELLDAISPHISQALFERLEEALIWWAPRWERSPEMRRFRGAGEQALLQALAPARRSRRAALRLGELERKLGVDAPEPPRGIVTAAVVSPIGPKARERMSTSQWVKAFATYDGREEGPGLLGGKQELARAIQGDAQNDPERWAYLALELPRDTPAVYLEHIVIGLSQPAANVSRLAPTLAFEVARHLATAEGSPAERELMQLIVGYAEEEVPIELIDWLGTLATAVPAHETSAQHQADGSEGSQSRVLWRDGLGSTRGIAAQTLGQFLAVGESRVEAIEPVLDRLVEDPSNAVRTCVVSALGALMRWRRDEAIAMFGRLVEGSEGVLGAPPIEHFIGAAMTTHWAHVRDTVERMLDSPDEETVQAGARLACLAALQEQDAGPLLDLCVGHESQAVRRGAAQIAAANLSVARFSGRCSAALVALFDDEDETVRDEAAKAFGRLEGETLGDCRGLALAAVASKSYLQARTQLLYALKRSTADISMVTLALAARMAIEYRGPRGEVRPGSAGEGKSLSELLVRVLGDSEHDADARRQALDALDGLTAGGTWGVVDVLASADR